MALRHFYGDLTLLRESISLLRDFGFKSTDQLLRIAEFLERNVYPEGSLHRTVDGVGFSLVNAPLRVGAFSAVRVMWDGTPVPMDRAFVRTEDHAVERSLGDIGPLRPLELRPGVRTDFRLVGVSPDADRHTVRLEFQSVAIPPLVWLEFTDAVSESPPVPS